MSQTNTMQQVLDEDLLRVSSDVSADVGGRVDITVHLRTADATVDTVVQPNAEVEPSVRRALDIPAAKPGVQILLGGESIAEGSFEENGVEGGATEHWCGANSELGGVSGD